MVFKFQRIDECYVLSNKKRSSNSAHRENSNKKYSSQNVPKFSNDSLSMELFRKSVGYFSRFSPVSLG